MTDKRALITGITGQDGSYLAEYLLELGYEVSQEDLDSPYILVSGRKGFGVKADDLIDKLIAATREEVDKRQTGGSGDTAETERRKTDHSTSTAIASMIPPARWPRSRSAVTSDGGTPTRTAGTRMGSARIATPGGKIEQTC